MTTPRVLRRIGTAHTPGATRVMLLGSGELGKEVAIAFQRFGVEVIAVDRYYGAPAQQVAHRSYTIDMADPDQLLRLIRVERPDFVIPEIEALATDALALIQDEGTATVIPTPLAVQLTMNREGIRRLAAERLGLPTSPYQFASSREEMKDAIVRLGLPCVVKPIMSASGHGQTVVRRAEDMDAAWERAREDSRVDQGRVIVEGFVDFDYEITLLTVRGIDPETGETVTRFCAPIGHHQENGDYVASWQPQPMTEAALATARKIAAKVTSALGGRGIFGVELFVKGDDVLFSEVSPRPHDTGLVTLGSQRLSEFELHARAVLGLPIDTTLLYPAASSVIKSPYDGEGLGFWGVDAALATPGTDVRLFGKPEAHVGRRLGVVVATGVDVEDALNKSQSAAQKIRVVR